MPADRPQPLLHPLPLSQAPRRGLTPTRPLADPAQPLPTHLRELRGALLGPLLLFGLLLASTFAASGAILRAMLDYHGLTGSVSLYAPAEFLRVRLGLAALAALLGALPLALLQIYRFARPGLTTRERGFAQRAIPLSLALFAGGTALGWLVVLPRLLPLLAGGPGEAQFSLGQTVSLLLSLSLGTGLALQLPLLAFMARRAGLWDGGLAQARKLAWGLLLALALFVTPDPSTIGLLLATALLVLLFEAGNWLAGGTRG
ncbi:MAG: hypothetical protein BEU05_02005 [Marine Group III euryarchaeote CG-Bathy2]|uniref:Sec-independent protein translocase protein TatC n=1 Tax=Marine Group III euryarchaeote CG-Bathy2 TaxID=1889002 RepID=A0A1J5T8K0_9ARCH|nr:MAG: hypothetical protein BEU05_02005 [Marine Group III euryarchaeote CG-Bathy2]